MRTTLLLPRHGPPANCTPVIHAMKTAWPTPGRPSKTSHRTPTITTEGPSSDRGCASPFGAVRAVMAAAQPFDLNGAVSGFTIALVKEKITQLTDEYEKALEPDAVQIRDLLRHVDQKRLRFRLDKQRLLDGLRTTLSSLQASSDAIDAATSELEALAPAWLGILPPASALAGKPPTPAASTPPFSDTDARDATVEPDESGSKRRQEAPETHGRPEKKPKTGGCEVGDVTSPPIRFSGLAADSGRGRAGSRPAVRTQKAAHGRAGQNRVCVYTRRKGRILGHPLPGRRLYAPDFGSPAFREPECF